MPIRVFELRHQMGVGESYMSALLGACGLKHVRLVHKSTVLKFLKDNPNWKMPRPVKKEAQSA